MPEVSVQTCRSCTSATPGTAASRSCTAVTVEVLRGGLHQDADRRRVPSRQVRGRMNTPMATATSGSAHHQPVTAMSSAATITPSEPSRSPTTSR